MSEDDKPPTHADAEALAYDFFKHMTSLALITLGGVLTISQLPDIEIKRFSMTMIVIFLAIAGIAGFVGMDDIVRSRLEGKDASPRIRVYRKLCPAGFGIGIGAFLSAFLRGLS